MLETNTFPSLLMLLIIKTSFFFEQAGGTVLSAKLAKERGWAINIGGGFHHCCANEGGGFCAYADITLAIQFAYTRLDISRYETMNPSLEKTFQPFPFSNSSCLHETIYVLLM